MAAPAPGLVLSGRLCSRAEIAAVFLIAALDTRFLALTTAMFTSHKLTSAKNRSKRRTKKRLPARLSP
jgi:hypothetical protein